MRQKQKLIEEKKAETYAAKALEKQLAKEAKAAKKAASSGASEIIDKYMAPEEPKEDKSMEDIITVERVVPAEPEFTAKERDIIADAIREKLNAILPPEYTLEDLLTLCDLVKRLRG